MTSNEQLKNKKNIKCWAIFWTFLYLLLFPIFCYAALFTAMVFDNPHVSVPLGLSIIIISCFVPLSMLISIYLIWSNYSRAQYRRTLFFCALPILTFFAVLLLDALLNAFFLSSPKELANALCLDSMMLAGRFP